MKKLILCLAVCFGFFVCQDVAAQTKKLSVKSQQPVALPLSNTNGQNAVIQQLPIQPINNVVAKSKNGVVVTRPVANIRAAKLIKKTN